MTFRGRIAARLWVAGSVLSGGAKLGKAASECKYTRLFVFIKLS